MSYKDYLEAVRLIEQNNELIPPIYPQHERSIQKVEDILNVQVPKSYRTFLEKYGRLLFGANSIFGLDDKKGYALDYRRW